MPGKNKPVHPAGPATQDKKPVQVPPAADDETTITNAGDMDIIPDDDEIITPPYEKPDPGEGP